MSILLFILFVFFLVRLFFVVQKNGEQKALSDLSLSEGGKTDLSKNNGENTPYYIDIFGDVNKTVSLTLSAIGKPYKDEKTKLWLVDTRIVGKGEDFFTASLILGKDDWKIGVSYIRDLENKSQQLWKIGLVSSIVKGIDVGTKMQAFIILRYGESQECMGQCAEMKEIFTQTSSLQEKVFYDLHSNIYSNPNKEKIIIGPVSQLAIVKYE